MDGIESGAAKGWAFDPDRRDAALRVELRIDGRLFQTVVADEYREDLEKAGFGNGCHGFRTALPRAAVDGGRHTLEARIQGAGTLLQNSPVSMVFERAPELLGSESEPAARVSMPMPPGARVAPESALAGLSVVVATRNRAAALERCLRACMAASAGDVSVEFIAIDHGSTDATPDRLRALAVEFPNLKWRSMPDEGAGRARNLGVGMASHEVVLFLGDSVQPSGADFFRHHMNAHRMLPSVSAAAVGKIVWPNSSQERVDFLMAHVQGAGQQQFGYYNLVPHTWLDWRFFHTVNVSFKKSIAADWTSEGFRGEFSNGAFEDREFAFRINEKLEGGFRILYIPAAAATHHEKYTVREFIERQLAAGVSARAFTAAHPGAAKALGTDRLDTLLASPARAGSALLEDLMRMIEGVKSWGVVVEGRYNLGSQNWHGDLLNAIFELSFLQGYIMAGESAAANYGAAYQYALERFQEKMSTAASFEVFGRFPSFTLT